MSFADQESEETEKRHVDKNSIGVLEDKNEENQAETDQDL